MNTEKTSPSGPRPEETPVESMLKRLPEAYAAWERDAAGPDLARLQRRVGELLSHPAESATPKG